MTPPTESSPVATGPKDVFLHLLAIVALALTATHVGVLGFQLVNRFLPDPLGPSFEAGPLRWALATLVVVFPVYLWVTMVIERDRAHIPEKQRLRIRRWLLHATLFVAAVTIIGDLIALVYQYLSGELTLRFVSKAAVILAIAIVVFAYYRLVLQRDAGAPPPSWFPVLTRGVVVVITATIVGGFVLAGSPSRERLHRFDRERIVHLQSLQWQIVTHWQRTEVLPATLDDLRDPISEYVPPRDPTTGAPYEYRVITDRQFELCATFATDTTTGSAVPLPSRPLPIPVDDDAWEGWRHGIGRACFIRTIDPSRYPPRGGSAFREKPPRSP